MTITKYKRRSFKDVAAEAYSRGWSEGRGKAHKEAQEQYEALLAKMNNVSLRQLAWSRLTGLFKRSRHDV